MKPRNAVEKMFLDTFGTVTPIPEETKRRMGKIVNACVLYIHQGKTLTEVCDLFELEYKYIQEVKSNDRWDQFKTELLQIVQPSSLALLEVHDIERIQEERARRLSTVEKLIQAEQKTTDALVNMIPGTLAQSTAIANIAAIRKLVAATIGLDSHLVEQHAGRKAAITAHIARIGAGDLTPTAPTADKSSILDI